MRVWTSRTTGEKRAVVIAVVSAIGVSVGAGLAVASGTGKYVPEIGVTLPPEKAAAAKRSLPRGGPESTVPAPVPTGHIRPIRAVMLDATSPPVSPSLVRVSNGWMVSNGRTLVAVYAGTAGDDPLSGRFVIIRQDLGKGTQTEHVVNIPGAGTVTITDAPVGASVGSSAQHGALGYRAKSSYNGHLDLATDTIRKD